MKSTPLYIDRRLAGLRIRDVFFAEAEEMPPRDGVDLLQFLQSERASRHCTEFFTSLIDLRQEEQSLLEGIHKGFRYEIRRAREKDGLHAVFCRPEDSQLESFFAFYDAFAASRQLSPANRKKLTTLRNIGALELGWVPDVREDESGTIPWLCVHLYVTNGRRARLYHSASRVGQAFEGDRQRMGRANKLLHWQALTHFKAQGLAFFDMGGISMGAELKAIDDFKRNFGGEVVREYNRIEAASARGVLAVSLLRLKGWLSAIRRRIPPAGGMP